MRIDFHYYGTYCAAYLAGYSHEESLEIAYSAELTDRCSVKFLKSIGAPVSAATVQLQDEIMDMNPNALGRREISRIWTAFHFLPGDLNADPKRGSKAYKDKYRLICNPNGELAARTVKLAKDSGLSAAGIAMHVLADTWAHRYFAGTPSLVINNVSDNVYELIEGEEKKAAFKFDPTVADDLYRSEYISSIYRFDENSIMNLGHDRIGGLPDYSFARYRYIPAWGDYHRIEKNNPEDYLKAFCQMIYAMKYLRGEIGVFETDTYDFEAIEDYRDTIENILNKRTTDTSAEWKLFGESLSEQPIPDFDLQEFACEYRSTKGGLLKDFTEAAGIQKNMVAYAVRKSGNPLLGNVKEETGGKE